MNKTIENIMTRVSCRNFSEKKVSLGKVKQIVEAGKYAPSGMNRQICHILVVRSKSKVEKIRKAAASLFGRDALYGASTICIVYGKKDQPLLIQDGSVIMENMLVAAHSLGIDSCWIHCIKDIVPTPNTKLAKELGISEEYQVVGSAALGYRKDGTEIAIKPRKDDFIRYL